MLDYSICGSYIIYEFWYIFAQYSDYFFLILSSGNNDCCTFILFSTYGSIGYITALFLGNKDRSFKMAAFVTELNK